MSEYSGNAIKVFNYDLHMGMENDKGILTHLEILRQEATKDGDVIFSLPDNSRIWVHSLLFYIAAGKKLPSAFGSPQHLDLSSDTVETAYNDSGVMVTVLYVTEDMQHAFEDVINSCYTTDSLSGVWEAMGYPAMVFNGKEFEMDAIRNPILPPSMLPDFEIHLKEPGNKHSLFSVKVHKFLLARRIPYYETFFSSGFGDSSGMTSTVYTEEFTIFSLWTIANFVYQANPSSIFECYPTLRDYIAPSPVTPNQPPCCTCFGAERSIPILGTADQLLEIAKSAHYLQATNLENWAHYFLCELGHEFQCQGKGCAEFIPHILNLVVDNGITDPWIFENGISLLAQYKSISTIWKRPLLNCKPHVLGSLIQEVQTLSERESEKRRLVQLFVKLSNLRRLTSKSKNSGDWDTKLILPLMDHTLGLVATEFDNPDIISGMAAFFRGMNFSRPIGEELLERLTDYKTLGEGNCRPIFIGIMALMRSCGHNSPEIMQAKSKCVAWFERKWVTLSLTPSPRALNLPLQNIQKPQSPNNQDSDAQKKSAEVLELSCSPNSTPRKGQEKVKKPLATTSASEGNFFSIWKPSEIEALANELPVSVSDLLATSHRKRPSADDRYKSVAATRGKPAASRGRTNLRERSAPASGI